MITVGCNSPYCKSKSEEGEEKGEEGGREGGGGP